MFKNRSLAISFALIIGVIVTLTLSYIIISETKEPPPVNSTIAAESAESAEKHATPHTLLQSQSLLAETVTLQRFELPTEAIVVWRNFKAHKPALLLLSNDPFLTPVPGLMRPKASQLLQTASHEEIQALSNPHMAAPLLLPEMAVDAALRNELIGRYLWAIPMKDGQTAPTADTIKAKLLEYGLASPAETDTLELDQHGAIHGRLREQPFAAGTLKNLSPIKEPVIVHIDLSYYQAQYVNEMKTPLFQLLQDTLKTLQQMELKVLAVTFSYGNLDGRIALDVRFLGDAHADIMNNPEMLFDDLQGNYKRQADALYLETLFDKERARELYLSQESELPQSAWVQYNLYRSAAGHKQGVAALEHLAKAVALDNVFAMAYLDLADQALAAERPDDALRMLKLAGDTFMDNPSIKFRMADIAYSAKDFKTAEHLVLQLQKLSWSEIYHFDLQRKLDRFIQLIEEEQAGKDSTRAKEPVNTQGQ